LRLHIYMCAAFLLCCLCAPGYANEYSATILGPLGLNTVPSARMAPAGTISAGVSTLDPYVHGFIGFQIAEPLYINIRQSAEVSNINENADRLYPGADIKLRVLKESAWRPALAIGLQSAVGHKRMAGEYVVLSKRHNNFDFSGGIGWGRFGSAGHVKNPLKALSSHFGKFRSLDGEMPNDLSDWFTGENIGFFGGVEYFTPFLERFSIKLDWGADRYAAEKAAFNYNVPAPWSASLNYQPAPWAHISAGMQGKNKVMGRLSFQNTPDNWPFSAHDQSAPALFRPFRTDLAIPSQMMHAAATDNITLYQVRNDGRHASAMMEMNPHENLPRQLGRAVRHMANHAGPDVEEFYITPTRMNLRGPTVRLMRRDFESALAQKQGSAAEIWQNTEFITGASKPGHDDNDIPLRFADFFHARDFRLVLDNELSLSEEDSGTLYRSALVIEKTAPEFFGFLTSGTSLRINLKDNLDNIRKFRPRAILPVRSNIDDFAQNRFSLDRLYTSFTHSFSPSTHMAITGGYLEEMYGGLGGEILYRPFGKRFAFGGEAWLALKRDPFAQFNMGFNGDHLVTGHLSAWYDVPEADITLQARAGRYLAEDLGGTLALHKDFINGAKLEGFVTISDSADFDVFGGTTHAYHGIKLSMPLGSIKYVPSGSEVRFTAAPFGRDTGQSLDNPLKLYEITENFSKSHIIQHWDSVMD